MSFCGGSFHRARYPGYDGVSEILRIERDGDIDTHPDCCIAF